MNKIRTLALFNVTIRFNRCLIARWLVKLFLLLILEGLCHHWFRVSAENFDKGISNEVQLMLLNLISETHSTKSICSKFNANIRWLFVIADTLNWLSCQNFLKLGIVYRSLKNTSSKSLTQLPVREFDILVTRRLGSGLWTWILFAKRLLVVVFT